jgi:hypothetical protein
MILTAHFTNTGPKMSCTTKKIVALLAAGMLLSAPKLQSFDLKKDWHIAAGLIGAGIATTLSAQYVWKTVIEKKPCNLAAPYEYHECYDNVLLNYKTGKYVRFTEMTCAESTQGLHPEVSVISCWGIPLNDNRDMGHFSKQNGKRIFACDYGDI